MKHTKMKTRHERHAEAARTATKILAVVTGKLAEKIDAKLINTGTGVHELNVYISKRVAYPNVAVKVALDAFYSRVKSVTVSAGYGRGHKTFPWRKKTRDVNIDGIVRAALDFHEQLREEEKTSKRMARQEKVTAEAFDKVLAGRSARIDAYPSGAGSVWVGLPNRVWVTPHNINAVLDLVEKFEHDLKKLQGRLT